MTTSVYQQGGFGTASLFPSPVSAARDPVTTDTLSPTGLPFQIFQGWTNTATNSNFLYLGAGNWVLIALIAGNLSQLTGDGASLALPVAGSIDIAGGTNITTLGALGVVTVNLDAAITLATSVTSPIYTSSGVDTNINSAAGQDIILQMGDAAGVNKVSFEDSGSVEVLSIDSNGLLSALNALTVVGAFTQTAGVVSISEDNSANAVGIANGTTARVVDLASSAAAHVVSIGSVTGAASLSLFAGTGNFALEGDVTTTYAISGVGVNTGTITIGGGTGAQTLNMMNSTGVKTVNLATGAAANVVTIGTVTGAASLDLLAGTGNFTLEGNVATTYDISGTGVNTGTITIGGGTGAQTLNMMASTGVKTINLATGAAANLVTIGSVTGAASLDLLCGTGDFTLEGDVASTYDISSTGVNVGTVRLASGTGARTVEIAGGGTGAKTINIGAAASADLITIGDATGAGSLDLVCGTGNFTLEGNVATTYGISATGVNTGTITIGGGTGAQTLNMMGSTGGKTVNIAAGAGANLVTMGSVTGASSLDLLCGTGDFTLEGDVASTYDISGTGVNTGTITVGGGTGAQTLNMMNSTGVKTVNLATGAAANIVTIGSTNGAASLTLQSGTGEITVTGTVKEITSEFLTRSGDSITFQQSPILQSSLTTGVAPTGATSDVNLVSFQEGIIMEQFMIGAGQTIIAPRMEATGLSMALDQTATEGVEYNFGAARTNSRHAFVVGTAAAFFVEVEFNIGDMSGADPFVIGFRRSEANNLVFVDYTDYATIGMNQATSATEIVLMTELNAGGQTITNTTDAWGGDGTANTLRVLVSAAGVVTYTINGAAPTATAAFTFDGGDVVCPFIHLVQGADLSLVHGISFKCGFQA